VRDLEVEAFLEPYRQVVFQSSEIETLAVFKVCGAGIAKGNLNVRRRAWVGVYLSNL
jgi:hypothetical protein